jgi:hypothetical protein
VIFLFIGLALQNRNKGMKASRIIENVSNNMDPDFVALFLFCNASPMNRNITKVYIESDAAFLVLIALLSISNGYIGNIVMMFGPKMLDRPEDQGRAASILVFFLVLGLTVGALLSTPLLRLL